MSTEATELTQSLESDLPVAPATQGPDNADHAGSESAPESVVAGSSRRLFGFALANIRRRPERTVLAVAGIALAISAAVVMRTIASSYQVLGVDAVSDAVGDAPYWVVPEGGIRVDPNTGVILADAPPPTVNAPTGWTSDRTVAGFLPGHDDVALVGRSTAPAAIAQVSDEALRRLDLSDGATIVIGGQSLPVHRSTESGSRVTVSLDVADTAGATNGWLTLRAPPGDAAAPDTVAAATGLVVTSDPAVVPEPGLAGLVYSTQRSTNRLGFVSFNQTFAALLGSRVSSSVLGVISTVALLLGFVIAVSTFVASVQERRREFGIMASIGLTDEVLYFFLAESLVLFAVSYVVGTLLGGMIVGVAAPAFFTLRAWLEAAGLVAMYLPALGIVAALIPVHRLLQQRPVDLLAEHP